jgi:hypothetical protein
LISSFITFNALMPRHPHQLNYVMFSQFHEGLMAVSDQFWGDLVIVKCFNCNVTVKIQIFRIL